MEATLVAFTRIHLFVRVGGLTVISVSICILIYGSQLKVRQISFIFAIIAKIKEINSL